MFQATVSPAKTFALSATAQCTQLPLSQGLLKALSHILADNPFSREQLPSRGSRSYGTL